LTFPSGRLVHCSASELTARLGGELVGPDLSINGASIDWRTIRTRQPYVPIMAERDGHDFIRAALEAVAPTYLTAHNPVGGTVIRGRDTAAALLSFGALPPPMRCRLGRDALQSVVTGDLGSCHPIEKWEGGGDDRE
jgi:hypothetical protein